MNYLKDRQYYIDLYDQLTVERCRRIEEISAKNSSVAGKVVDEEDERAKEICNNLMLYTTTGEEYLEKEKTINEWMDRDAQKDKFLEETESPVDPQCLICKEPLALELKDLHGRDDEHILFFYRCGNKSHRGRAFFETGEEYIPEPIRCSKCSAEITEHKTEEEGKKLIITRHCTNCGQNDIDVYGPPKPEKVDPNFAKDRERFCLSEEDGKEYFSAKLNLENMKKFVDEQDKREADKPSYDQVEAMQKLTVVQLKQLLMPELKDAGYTSLVFFEPKMERHVIVGFTVEDSKDGRTAYESESQLKKLLKSVLYNVNWNPMMDSFGYRLGVLSGQLKGLETEADLLSKIKRRKPLA